MAVTIKPSASTQYMGGAKMSDNHSRVGLIAEGDGTTGKRWRMRYTFKADVQMSSFTVSFKLSSKLYGQVAVGVTSSSSKIAPRDYTVTMSSTTVTVKYSKALEAGTYYLWLDYAGSRFEIATCTTSNVTIEAVPAASTLTAADGTLGQEQMLTINAGSSEFTHTVQYAVGSATGTIATKTTEKTLTWTPPLTLAEQNTGGKSVSCTFTVITYVSGTENARSTKTVSYAIPAEAAPTLSVALSPDNGTMPSAFASLYVQGRSKLKATYTASTKYGAKVSGYKTTVGATASTHSGSSFVSPVLNAAGEISVKGEVTDSRGYSATVDGKITVEPYSPPTLIPVSGASAIVCGRANADGVMSDTGLNLRIRVGKRFSTVAGVNECILRYRIAEEGGSLGNWVTILDKGSSANEISLNTSDTLEATKAYVVEINVADDIGESMTVEYRIPTLDVPLHLGFGGKNVGIGRYADYAGDYRVDVGWDVHLASGVRIRPYPGEEEEVLEALGYAGSSDVADGSITTEKLADGAVGTSKLIDGAITNAKLASDVTAQALGGAVLDQLWVNASYTSNFAAQTISLDLSGYDSVRVAFLRATSVPRVFAAEAHIGGTGIGNLIATNNGTAPQGYNRIFKPTSTGVAFEDGLAQRTNSTTRSTDDSCMIPYIIFGIKRGA